MNSRIYFGIVAAVLFSSIFATRTLGANPTVIPQTLPADSISNREATLHGTITLNGKPARVAFQIRQAGKKRYVSRTPWQKVVRGQTNVSFSAIVTGLVADTDYEFRAIALVGVAQRRGNQLAFHSETEQPPLTPVATTGAAIDITT
ncbi:MAG TPA: hypothetical protein VNT99_20700, partial [Methylomirabilota bacterium]|nr:hypothetical protein [Methylomirabilota bacterium]